MAYISKITIKNYKKIKNIEFKPEKGINILVGKNGGGKTQILEYISIIFNDLKKDKKFELKIILDGEITEFKEEVKKQLKKPNTKINGENYHLETNEENNRLNLFNEILNYPINNNEIIITEDTIRWKETLNEIVIQKNTISKKAKGVSFEFDLYEIFLKIIKKSIYYIKEIRNLRSSIGTGEINENIIDEKTFFFQLNKLYNSIDKIDNKKYEEFKKLCHNEGFDIDIINVQELKIKIKELKYEEILTNENVPSGYLQKIYFNYLIVSSKNGILLIDEPEINLHPQLQRELIHKLNQNANQIFIATHSPELLSLNNTKIFLVENSNEITVREIKKEVKDYYNIDKRFLFANGIIIVEGYTEYRLLPKIIDEISGTTGFFELNGLHLINQFGKDNKKIPNIIKENCFNYIIIHDNGKGEKEKNGWNEQEKKIILSKKDFDSYYNDDIKTLLKYSNENQKDTFAYAILEYCLNNDKKLIECFNENGKKNMQDIYDVIIKVFKIE